MNKIRFFIRHHHFIMTPIVGIHYTEHVFGVLLNVLYNLYYIYINYKAFKNERNNKNILYLLV